jgi:hypothetical protein
VEALSSHDIPKNPRITAEAVFRDGSTQTVDVHLDLSGMGVFGGNIPTDDRDGMPVAYRQFQYYKKLPLEECELVDLQTVTDRDSFDEDGMYRVRRQRLSGSFYLLVLQLEGGTCAARLYRVPEKLEYSPENEARQQAEAEDAPAPESSLPAEPAAVKPIPEAGSPAQNETGTGPSAAFSASPNRPFNHWVGGKNGQAGHPYQKPEAVFWNLIAMAAKESGIVFDPMAGPGTTGASERKNRGI